MRPTSLRGGRRGRMPGSGRQTTLFEYAWLVTFRYVPMRSGSVERRGLSERELKRRLERQGWKVWRGGLIGILRREELYPNVRRKYGLLRELVERRHPGTFELLEYLCAVHHGMPDFLCHHPAKGFLFVECKLGHEGLSEGQKRCIRRLQLLGFEVEVHKLVEPCTKTRAAAIDLENGEKSVLERQLRIGATVG